MVKKHALKNDTPRGGKPQIHVSHVLRIDYQCATLIIYLKRKMCLNVVAHDLNRKLFMANSTYLETVVKKHALKRILPEIGNPQYE